LAVFDFPTNCKPHGTPQHAAVLPIRPATPEDIEAVERLHRAVRTACLPYLPELHTPEEDLRFFRERVLPAYTFPFVTAGSNISMSSRLRKAGDWARLS
jgi:hypothetical protein